MQEVIKILPIEFIGKGEVKGFHFRQVMRERNICLYEVLSSERNIYYEVFIVKNLQRPKTKELYEAYPKANSFGICAWTYCDFNRAILKFNQLLL